MCHTRKNFEIYRIRRSHRRCDCHHWRLYPTAGCSSAPDPVSLRPVLRRRFWVAPQVPLPDCGVQDHVFLFPTSGDCLMSWWRPPVPAERSHQGTIRNFENEFGVPLCGMWAHNKWYSLSCRSPDDRLYIWWSNGQLSIQVRILPAVNRKLVMVCRRQTGQSHPWPWSLESDSSVVDNLMTASRGHKN